MIMMSLGILTGHDLQNAMLYTDQQTQWEIWHSHITGEILLYTTTWSKIPNILGNWHEIQFPTAEAILYDAQI